MALFSFGSNKDRYSDVDIIKNLKASDESREKKILAFLRKKYSKTLFLHIEDYQSIKLGINLFENVLQRLKTQIKEEGLILENRDTLFKIFRRKFDQQLLINLRQFNKANEIHVKEYLTYRFKRELVITKEISQIQSLVSPTRSLFQISFEAFYKNINTHGFKLLQSKSLGDVFELEWDSVILETLQVPLINTNTSNSLMKYLNRRFRQMPAVNTKQQEATAIAKKAMRNSQVFSFEDIYNDAFIGFIQGIKSRKFEKKSKLTVYFFSILKYKIIDFYRSLPTNKEIEAKLYEANLDHEQSVDPEILQKVVSEPDVGDVNRKVNDAINQLSVKCQEILRLHYLSELPLSTISKNIDLTVYELKKRLEECYANFKKIYVNLSS